MTKLKKMMLMGECRSGKSTIIKALSGEDYKSGSAMAVYYCGDYIETPGEFLENSRFYPALITTSADVGVVAMVQDGTRINSVFPPLFSASFVRRVVGIITKIDHKEANIKRAERFLKTAGAKDIIYFSSKTGEGLNELKKVLA